MFDGALGVIFAGAKHPEWTLGYTDCSHVMMTMCLTGSLGYICKSKVLTLNGLLGTPTVPHVMMTVCLTGLLGLYLQE